MNMRKCFILVILLLITAFFSSCEDVPSMYQDETVIPLKEEINTIQDAYEFASNRVNEQGINAAKLKRIIVYFTEDQINAKRGIMEYIFCVDNGKDNYLAEYKVTIDMEKSVSTLLDVWFDARTKGGNSAEHWEPIITMDMSEWTLTLDEAFDIVYETLGNNAFSKFENPKITLFCHSDKWTFDVTKEDEIAISSSAKHYISVNPITKEVIEIKGFGEDNTL